jgi:hypothetical protein
MGMSWTRVAKIILNFFMRENRRRSLNERKIMMTLTSLLPTRLSSERTEAI